MAAAEVDDANGAMEWSLRSEEIEGEVYDHELIGPTTAPLWPPYVTRPLM